MSIQEEIREFIVDTFLFGEDDGLKENSSFLEEGIVDSTGIMQLVAYLQEQYLITIEDEELIPDNLDSLQKVKRFVEAKKRASKPEAALAVSEIDQPLA